MSIKKLLSGRIAKIALFVVVVVFVGMQFIPVTRENPPVQTTIKWDSPKTESFARRACFDCHSNETKWPWYSRVAPVSWLVSRDVIKGRKHLNFSEEMDDSADEMIEEIQKGQMPMSIYLPMHPEARLTDAEKTEFIEGLRNTFSSTESSATQPKSHQQKTESHDEDND